MKKVFCMNCRHYKSVVFDWGKCTNSKLVEKYTRVISVTSQITGKTSSFRVMGGSYDRQIDAYDGISTIFGNGNMDCKYYEVKPPSVSLWERIKKIFGR